MPTLTIKIKMDNAAFDHNGAEVSRILLNLSDSIVDFDDLRFLAEPLLDSNGNTVGEAKVTR